MSAFERVPGNAIYTPTEQAERDEAERRRIEEARQQYVPLSPDTARACEAVITGPAVPCDETAPLPSAAAIRAYLKSAGWTERPPGNLGSIWAPPPGSRRVAGIGVPFGDSDPDVMRGVIRRVAAGEGRTGAAVARTITAVYGGGEVPGAHADRDEEIACLRGSLDAAEAKLASYDSAISWATSCTACARTLDASIADHDRAGQAEAKLAAIAALCDAAREYAATYHTHLKPYVVVADIEAIISGEEEGNG